MDDALFAYLRSGKADLQISAPVVWRARPPCVRGEAPVSNNVGRRLVVGMQICRLFKPAVYLMDVTTGRHAWRLDVAGSHSNRRTNGEVWVNRNHVNVWRDDIGDKHAVDPWFPLRIGDPGIGVGQSDLRGIFEDFCRGSAIDLGQTDPWSEPPVGPNESDLEGDVP